MVNINDFVLVDDEVTAYDEVINDLEGLSYVLIKDDEWQKLVRAKCSQLRRILGEVEDDD